MSTYQDAEGKTRSSLNIIQRMLRLPQAISPAAPG